MFIRSLRLIITKRKPTTQETINKILLSLPCDIGRYALYRAVVRVNDQEGTVQLSKKKLDGLKIWDEMAAFCEDLYHA